MITSKDTEKTLTNIEEIKNPKVVPISKSREEETKIWFIMTRKNAMAWKRNVNDKSWKQYIKQYEAQFIPYSDWRASSNVPLERAIIELFVAEAIKRKTNFRFNSCLWYEFQWQVLEKVWKYDWSVNNRENEILQNEYITAIFWTSIIYTWYERSYRVFEDFEGENDDWTPIFQRKMQTNSDILVKNIDIRDFWIDDRAKSIDDAIDCIYETYIAYEDFLNMYLDWNYDKEKLNSIVPSKSKYDFYRPFIVQEERGDWEGKYIKITKYWNKKLDRYFEVANESVLIRETPIMNASHSLPFVIRQYWKNPFSVYWFWLCEALVTFKSDINKLREMLMEAIKRSNQEVIAIWSNLTFDWNQFAYNNQFVKFKWNLQWNFQHLSGNPPNQAIFSRLQDLFREVAIFVWIDIMNILWEPQQTAYQTAVQKESSLQRVNVVLKNRDMALERFANLHKDNLQMFFPLKLVRELVKINEDNEPIEEVDATYPIIETEKIKWKKFLKWSNKEIFEVTPERIRGKIMIDVSTDLNAPTITEVDKAQKMEFYNGIVNLTNAYNANPELETIIPKRKAIIDLARLNNIDTEQQTQTEVNEEKKKLYEELQNMMKWMRTPVQEKPQEQQSQNISAVSPEWQPKEFETVRTPNIS